MRARVQPRRGCRMWAVCVGTTLAAWCLGSAPSHAQPRYVVIDLGILDEAANSSEAIGINDAGTVTGSSGYDGTIPNAFRAVVATDQGMTLLAQPAGGVLSRGFGINATGQVAGWDQVPGGTDRRLPVRWTGGTPTLLDTLPQHTNARGLAINASGVVVGQSSPGPTGGDGARAVVWNGTSPVDLGTLGGQQSLAQGINDAGQVVGWSLLSDGSVRATLWANGSSVNLGSAANFSYATAINNKGQIVGASTGPNNARAVLWDQGEMRNLGTGTLGVGDSVAYDINEHGVAVGEYTLQPSGTRGFLWYLGEVYDLTTLVHPSSAGWTVDWARSINDAGQIAGRACHPDVGCRAVRLDPVYTQYLAEGATSSFFDTRIAILNPGTTATTATMTFLPGGGAPPVVHAFPVAGLTRTTVDPKTLPGLGSAEFSTVVESDQLLVVDRTMSWDASGYGSHAETGVAAPSPTWYLAEGATHSGFSLFYLLQNPSAASTTVRVRYLRASAAPLEKEYVLPAASRTNIWVNVEDFPGEGTALANAEFSAVIESLDGTPIIVERAMYRSNQGRTFNAGHESMGITRPSTQWFFAEGATGTFFDLFVLIANPGSTDANVKLTYLLGDGQTFTRTMTAPANQRSGVWVDVEQFPGIAGFPLEDVALSTKVESTNGVPLIAERAMWWPGDFNTWQEAHNSAGSRVAGIRWALAEGEVGGTRAQQTYILIANTSAFDGTATVQLVYEDGESAELQYALPANSRTNVPVGVDFPASLGRRFGAIVESTGATPAQIVVERAMYSDAGGVALAAGTNALATRIP